jgi:7 transmembrane receptor (Secretin family)
MYSLYAWGVPMIIVVIGIILDNVGDLPGVLRPHFAGPDCLISSTFLSRIAYVHGPIGAILSMNILLFILTAVNIHRTGDDTASTPKTRRKKRKYYNQTLSFILSSSNKFVFIMTELCYFSPFQPFSWEEHGVYMSYLMTQPFTIFMLVASFIFLLEFSFLSFSFVRKKFSDYSKECNSQAQSNGALRFEPTTHLIRFDYNRTLR